MNPKLVFDIGMHTGEDTIYYLKNGFDVVAVEANPLLAEAGKQKFREYITQGRLTILNVGIAPEKGTLPFYICKRLSVWSSFNKESATKGGADYEVVDVPCVPQSELFEQYGIPYYLKVDIEGYDYLSLKDLPVTGDKPKYVSFEVSNITWLDIVKDKGYTKFKLINQLNHKEINLRNEKSQLFVYYLRALYALKKYFPFLPFRHEGGSSGPFGTELRGKWYSYNEIKELYQAFYNDGQQYNKVSWFDCHATF